MKDAEAPRLQGFLRRNYEKLLRGVSRYPFRLLWSSSCLSCSCCRGSQNWRGFLPEFREGHFVLGVSTAPGASLEENAPDRRPNFEGAAGESAHRDGRAADRSRRRTRRGHLGPASIGVSRRISSRSRPTWRRACRPRSNKISRERAGISLKSHVPRDRIGESISGVTAPVAVNLFGENLDVLDEKRPSRACARACRVRPKSR